MGEGIILCQVQHVWTILPVPFALKYCGPALDEGYKHFTEYHYHLSYIYCKMTGTMNHHFSILQKLGFLWSNLLNKICCNFKGSVANTVEVRELSIFKDYININHTVNLVISKVACSYHSNKHKINSLLPRNAYASLSYLPGLLKTLWKI